MEIKKEFISDIEKRATVSKAELSTLINRHYGEVSRSYFYRITAELVKEGALVRIDPNAYTTEKKPPFSYSLTDSDIDSVIKAYGDFVLWDTNILNKWMNHLLNSVITFVDVDRDLMYLVANDLKEAGHSHVLINPSVKEFHKYFDRRLVVIEPLAKSLADESHRISIEKLIVELYSNKIVRTLYGDDDLKKMLHEIFRTYNINLKRVYHIAKRKKIYDKLYSFLSQNMSLGFKFVS